MPLPTHHPPQAPQGRLALPTARPLWACRPQISSRSTPSAARRGLRKTRPQGGLSAFGSCLLLIRGSWQRAPSRRSCRKSAHFTFWKTCTQTSSSTVMRCEKAEGAVGVGCWPLSPAAAAAAPPALPLRAGAPRAASCCEPFPALPRLRRAGLQGSAAASAQPC